MTLKEQIIADLTTAMKAREALTVETLRSIKAEVMKFEVSGADKIADDDTIITILKRAVKQRKEAAEAFNKGGKSELAEKEMNEVEIIEKYLPEQMSEEAVKVIAEEVLTQVGGDNFGKLMGAVMGRCKGQADGNLVSKVVKELIG